MVAVGTPERGCCAKTIPESSTLSPFELPLSEKQIRRFVGNALGIKIDDGVVGDGFRAPKSGALALYLERINDENQHAPAGAYTCGPMKDERTVHFLEDAPGAGSLSIFSESAAPSPCLSKPFMVSPCSRLPPEPQMARLARSCRQHRKRSGC
jgi:hypothetical protein